MWLSPTLANVACLGHFKWKNYQQTQHFLLQSSNCNHNKVTLTYRIITRSFPSYMVASSDTMDIALEYFRFLNEDFIEQFPIKRPKDLVNNLKLYYQDFPDLQSISFESDEDNDIDEVSSRKHDDVHNSYELSLQARWPSESTVGEHDDEHSLNFVEEEPILSSSSSTCSLLDDEPKSPPSPANPSTYFGHVYNLASQLPTLISYPNGVKEQEDSSNPYLFPMKALKYLQYPTIMAEDGTNKKGSFQLLREVHMVNQRRKILFGLTLYSLILRYCSFDLFLMLAVISNLLVLYFLKNTAKINLKLAKNTVKTRVGLAKQWAGGLLFRNKASTEPKEQSNLTSNFAKEKASLDNSYPLSDNQTSKTSKNRMSFFKPNSSSNNLPAYSLNTDNLVSKPNLGMLKPPASDSNPSEISSSNCRKSMENKIIDNMAISKSKLFNGRRNSYCSPFNILKKGNIENNTHIGAISYANTREPSPLNQTQPSSQNLALTSSVPYS